MNNAHARFPCLCVLTGLSIAWLGMAHAQDTSSSLSGSPVSSMPASWRTVAVWPVAVSDGRLDDTRGGVDLGNGLLASFGIARMVYINGNLVSSTHVDIPDIGRMTPAQASALATATETVNTIQNGAGNTVDPATFDHATAATVIQNSLDNQDIRSLTTINAAVNSLNTFHALGLQESLQAGVIGSLGH
ncbi:MAG TPA: hypothetical protein VNZ27_16250 [Rhodanobacter sp.]|jgi:hypothetical protein|nr:hypothetical protein [Rhodanobacter sp.]